MYCDKCGQELRDDARFCPKCGARFLPDEELRSGNKQIKQTNNEPYQDRYAYEDVDRIADGSKRKNKKKLIIILSSIAAGLIAVAAAVFIIVSLNSGITVDKAYKKYFQVLKDDRDSIVEFEDESGANGVAITDINNTGIPDVLYITNGEEGSENLCLHSVMDNGNEFDVDTDVSISGEFDSDSTIFKTDHENALYILSENGLRKLLYTKDNNGNTVAEIKVLAKRTYDEDTEEYTYTVFSESGESEEVDEEDYNAYIADICNNNITIIISALSEEELEKLFPVIDDNISQNCDEALEQLKGDSDIAPAGQDNDKQNNMDGEEPINDEPTEPSEEEDRNFVSGGCLVEYNDVIYYVDDNGLWKKEAGSDSELLNECSALNIATDGRVIFYGVFNEEVTYSYGTYQIKNYQYDMYRYDLNTGTNEKIFSCIEAGKPICAIGDIVYYTDFPDDFDGNRAGLAQGLCSYNMATGEKEYICGGAHLVDSCNGKIFYREIMAAGGNYGVHQIHCYDTETGESETISEDNVLSFKIISDKLYYEVTSFSDFSGDAASNKIWIYSYDISLGETEKLFEKSAQINNIKYYDDKYVFFSKDDSFVRYDLATGEEEKLPLYILDGSNPESAWHYGDETVLAAEYNAGHLYLMDDNSMEITARSEYCTWRTVLKMKDNIVYTIDKDSNNAYFYTVSLHELK